MSMRMVQLKRRIVTVGLLAVASLAWHAPSAVAADVFPSKPISLILPFPAGGSVDPIFRTFAEAASRELGQPVVLMHPASG